MNKTIFANLQNFRASLNARFLEREEVIDGLLTSLITRQNAFLFGAPGTGKSELVRAVSKGFDGSGFFSYLLSPTTDPSELFGPVAISKLLEDEYTRDVDGYLPSANIAFLDELFRGSSSVLNSLLTILNERTFNNGKEIIETPLQSIVAATNSFPSEESLQAFCDRFLFRPTVSFLKKPVSKRSLDRWALGVGEPRPLSDSKLSYEDLLSLQEEVSSIEINDDFLDDFHQVMETLSGRGIQVSDRRRVQILNFMRGWAIVQGDTELVSEHLHNSLIHIVYRDVEDIVVIKDCLDQIIPTANKLLHGIKLAGSEIASEYHAIEEEGSTLSALNAKVMKLRKLHRDLLTLEEKLTGITDSGKYKINIETAGNAVRINRQLVDLKTSITKSIAKFSL
jgi:MoxR-like ATPase